MFPTPALEAKHVFPQQKLAVKNPNVASDFTHVSRRLIVLRKTWCVERTFRAVNRRERMKMIP
jgi:hypothetical protein